MGYPQVLNSRIRVRDELIDRDIADCNGFDVESRDCNSLVMVRRRPPGMMFVGQPEFLASLSTERILQAINGIQCID